MKEYSKALVVIVSASLVVVALGCVVAHRAPRCRADMNEGFIVLETANGLCRFVEVDGRVIPGYAYTGVAGDQEFVVLNRNSLVSVLCDGKWGLADNRGRMVPIGTDGARKTDRVVAAVQANDGWRFVTGEGVVVVSDVYVEAQQFSEDLCWARTCDGQWHVVDRKGKRIGAVASSAMAPAPFSCGLARIVDDSGIYLFVDQTCRPVLAFTNTVYVDSFAERFAAITPHSRTGFVNAQGRMVIPPIYDMAGAFSEDYAAAVRDGTYGFVSTNGDFRIVAGALRRSREPGDDYVLQGHAFSDGRAAVQGSNGLWGYVDYGLQWAIPPKYKCAHRFRGGWAVVATETGYVLIDRNGKARWSLSFRDLE